MELPAAGDQIEIHYPEFTCVHLYRPRRLKRRQLVITSVRDLLAEPLSAEEFLRRPFLLRSRWLAQAVECHRHRPRQFYLGSSAEFRSPGSLKVGIYEPGAPRPSRVIGRQFEPTLQDRKLLIHALREWLTHDLGEARLMIFSDDLRRVG
ncbi:hypothetical protein Pla52o_35540 [Novipirellula galeiformis]|uniref:Uncharacterized protein n=1 Tax=Novipirellula galeiformis TaxID=2528004 RepID=A0A5C6CFH5_9BACT|nr:hypothetical protein Pla52o_35540 [Novipirellula galeiformis]